MDLPFRIDLVIGLLSLAEDADGIVGFTTAAGTSTVTLGFESINWCHRRKKKSIVTGKGEYL